MNHEQIINYTQYCTGMRKSIEDKIDFIDPFVLNDVTDIYDFGCGNGDVLKELNNRYPDVTFHEIDSNRNMINYAAVNLPETVQLLASDQIPVHYVSEDHTRSMLFLSSVIHEVYSYGTEEYIKRFWEMLRNSNHHYICIRDMMVSAAMRYQDPIYLKQAIYKHADITQMKDFESVWGPITTADQAIHFLLKYRYVENWSREVTENYLPITLEKFLNLLPFDKYRIVRLYHYTLPFLVDKLHDDFDINFHYNTHVKVVLQKPTAN